MSYNIQKTNKTIGFVGNTQVFTENLIQFTTNSAVFTTVASTSVTANKSISIEVVGTCLDTTTANEASSFRILAGFYSDAFNNVFSISAPNIVELENIAPNIAFQFTTGVGTINFKVHNGNADNFRWTIKYSQIIN